MKNTNQNKKFSKPQYKKPFKSKYPIITIPFTEREKKLVDWFGAFYPKAFDVKNPVPLARNIHLELRKDLAKDSTISNTLIFKTMMKWTRSIKYRMSIVQNDHRIDLKGVKVAQITEKEKNDAYLAVQQFIAKEKNNQSSSLS